MSSWRIKKSWQQIAITIKTIVSKIQSRKHAKTRKQIKGSNDTMKWYNKTSSFFVNDSSFRQSSDWVILDSLLMTFNCYYSFKWFFFRYFDRRMICRIICCIYEMFRICLSFCKQWCKNKTLSVRIFNSCDIISVRNLTNLRNKPFRL